MIFIRPFYFIECSGRENIPKKGSFILCCNHISYFDPVILGLVFKKKIFFMAKSEFFTESGVFVRNFMKLCGVFSVKRQSSDITALNRASELLRQNKIIGIFPQGKIDKIDAEFEPKAGAALLAVKEQVSILPVVIDTKEKIRCFQKIIVKIGRQIEPPADDSLKSARFLNQVMKNQIKAQLGECVCQK